MPENFFEPGKKSHCLFTPDLWCDVYEPNVPFAPFPFLCDVVPQTVAVIIPAPSGKAGDVWNRVYETIARVWQDRTIGFHCKRVPPESWTDARPCDACSAVREAQVVVLDYQGGDLRAAGFRELAATSTASLQFVKTLEPLAPAPTKRVILISSGPIAPPPHYQKIFDWIDYTGENGQPDFEKLAKGMETVAREGLFQAAEPLRFDLAEFENEPLPADVPADVPEGASPADEDDLLSSVRVLGETPVSAASTRREADTEPVAVLDDAEDLAARGEYVAAMEALRDQVNTPETEAQRRRNERDWIARMSTRELTEVYFRGLTARHRMRHELSPWRGEPPSAQLQLHGDDLMKLLGAEVTIYTCERLDAAAAAEVRRQLPARPGGSSVLVVADACEPAACGSFAAMHAQRVWQIHGSDVRRWALARKSPMDGLRERLRGGYRRPDDLFLRGLHGPVWTGGAFFGRRKLLEQLERSLQSGDGFVLHGLPGVGKTSVLWRLSRLSELAAGHLPVLVDLRGHAHEPSAVYVRTVRAVRQAATARYSPQLRDLAAVDPLFALSASATAEAYRGRFAAGLKALAKAIGRIDPRFRRITLLFDDVESIVSAESQVFFSQIHDLMQEGSITIGLIGASISFQQQLESASSPLPGMQGRAFFAQGLEPGECAEMVRSLGHRMYGYFDDEAVERIALSSGGHPLLVRYLCSLFFEELFQDDGAVPNAIVTGEAVRRGAEQAVAATNVRRWLERIYGELSQQLSASADLLQVIAHESRAGEAVDHAVIEQRAQLTPLGIERSFQSLTDLGLIDNADGEVRPRIGLVNRWLQQQREIEP